MDHGKDIERKYREDKKTINVISAGGVVFRNEDNKILLIRRTDEKIWCLPKGKIEHGEAPIDAALREIKEETGLNVVNQNKKYARSNSNSIGLLMIKIMTRSCIISCFQQTIIK